MTTSSNPFSSSWVADVYRSGRIDYHGTIQDVVLGDRTGRAALDVGCGTGQSTVPLRRRFDRVIGLDIATEMVGQARRHPGVCYLVGSAERLPFPTTTFDAAVVATAFHWMEGGAALEQLARVLRPGGSLHVYGCYLTGAIEGDEAFGRWLRDGYIRRYPRAARGPNVNTEAAHAAGFVDIGGRMDRRLHLVCTAEQMVEHILSQGNSADAVASGLATEDELRRNLHQALDRSWPSGQRTATCTFGFWAHSWTAGP